MKNKKEFMQRVLEFNLDERKKKIKKKEFLRKKYEGLSLQDKDAFDRIIERKNFGENAYTFFILIPKTIFLLAIFGILLYFFLDIDVISSFVGISLLFFKMWLPLILFGFILDLIDFNKRDKLKEKLLGVK